MIKTSRIEVRVEPEVRARISAAAEEAGLTLSQLLLRPWGEDAPKTRTAARSREDGSPASGEGVLLWSEDLSAADAAFMRERAADRGVGVGAWLARLIAAVREGRVLEKERPAAKAEGRVLGYDPVTGDPVYRRATPEPRAEAPKRGKR